MMFGIWSAQNDKRLTAAASRLFPGRGFDRFACRITGVQKFPGDCLCEENERWSICCEGCILNREQLADQYGCSLFDVIAQLCQEGAEAICRTLKGSYVVAAFNKQTGSLIVTNDLLSKLQLYYCSSGDTLIWSTSFFEVYDFAKELGFGLTVDRTAVAMLLRYRYMFEDFTYAREIRYLSAFRSLNGSQNEISVEELSLPASEQSIDADYACSKLDKLFLDACGLQYRKNAANGYIQLSSLSGGMDSKAVFLAGMRAGYATDRAFTYAEPGSLDETISQAIAADHCVPHLFHSIAKGNFIKDRQTLISGGEGHIYYAGTTGLCGMAASMRTDDTGIVHSGLGGGEVLGDICCLLSGTKAHEDRFRAFADSLKLPDDLQSELLDGLTSRYTDYNLFMNISDLRQCVNMIRTSQQWFIPMSPFLDEDFFCFAVSIPAAMKKERALYRRWCTEYMSNPYMTTSDFVTSKENSNTGVRLRRLYHRVQNKLTSLTGKKTSRDMNPFFYWEKTNPEIRSAMDSMLDSDLSVIGNCETDLANQLRSIYSTGTIFDRLCVLTVTWVLAKMYRQTPEEA